MVRIDAYCTASLFTLCTFSHACLFITIAILASLATTHSCLNSNTIGIALYITYGRIYPHIKEQAVVREEGRRKLEDTQLWNPLAHVATAYM